MSAANGAVALASGLSSAIGGGAASSGLGVIAQTAMALGQQMTKFGQDLGGSAGSGDTATGAKSGEEKVPSFGAQLEAALTEFFVNLGKELEGLPTKFTDLLETTGKDALKAILDPLKEAGKGFLDSLIGDLFGKKEKASEEVAETERAAKPEGADEAAGGKKSPVSEKISENLQGVFKGFGEKFESIFTDFGGTFKGLLGDLTGNLGGIFEGLLGNLGGLFGGGGGIFSSLLGGITSMFGFAGGGRIQPGIPTIVGERGPELIVPSRSGTVLNAADSRNASGKSVSVNQTIHFDLVPSPTISAMIDSKKPEIERAAIEGTMKAMNRGAM